MRAPAAILVASLALAGGCVISPVRYSYPTLAEGVEGACDRLETTIEIADEEGGRSAAHETALAAAREAQAALEHPRVSTATADALETAAAKLDGAAEQAWVAIRSAPGQPAPSGAQRDRLYDLAVQSRRAARACRSLAWHIAGAP